MTARANTEQSIAIMEKRADRTPKAKLPKRGINKGQGLVARARGNYTNSAAQAAEVDVNKPLTDKQKAFVQFWAQGESITSASLRAGYNDSASVAYRLVRMPNVLALKAKYEAEWEATGAMSRQKVMDGMLESIEMAKLMSEPSSMIAGWREIGKICGYYAPVEVKMKVDVTGNIVLDKMNSLSDAELLKIITEGNSNALLNAPESPAP